MLMAEEVLLLLVDDRTGRFLVDSTRLDNVLAGAVLVELVTIERVVQPGRVDQKPAGSVVNEEQQNLLGHQHSCDVTTLAVELDDAEPGVVRRTTSTPVRKHQSR